MNPLIREANGSDLDDLIDCWQESFLDSKDFIQKMLIEVGLINSAIVAEFDGRVRSAMFAFEGLVINHRKASYLYALCTHPRYRGQGLATAVCRERINHSLKNGSQFVFLAPASEALCNWYCQTFQMSPVIPNSVLPLPSLEGNIGLCEPISLEEFLYLRNTSHNSYFTKQLLMAQQLINDSGNGGFFRMELTGGNALASVCISGKTIIFKELLCPSEALQNAIATIAAYFHLPQSNCTYADNQLIPLLATAGSGLFESDSFLFPYRLD